MSVDFKDLRIGDTVTVQFTGRLADVDTNRDVGESVGLQRDDDYGFTHWFMINDVVSFTRPTPVPKVGDTLKHASGAVYKLLYIDPQEGEWLIRGEVGQKCYVVIHDMHCMYEVV